MKTALNSRFPRIAVGHAQILRTRRMANRAADGAMANSLSSIRESDGSPEASVNTVLSKVASRRLKSPRLGAIC